MAESVKSRILWVIIGAFITFMLSLNAYYQKGTNEATQDNNKEMQKINQNLTEFKTDQEGKNEFVLFRLTEHDNKIKENSDNIKENSDNIKENSDRITIVENKVNYLAQ